MPPTNVNIPQRCGQIWAALLCAFLSVCLLILTAVYASDTAASTRIRFTYSSSSRTIFVLSLLSGLNGICLAATIHEAVDRLKWVLIARPNGLSFLKFLSLDPGTGVWGLATLGFSQTLPLTSSTRIGSIIRLLSVALLPILGILIMSMSNKSTNPLALCIQADGSQVMSTPECDSSP